MDVTTIGLDIAKNVFQVHGVDDAGTVVIRRQLRRSRVLPFFEKQAPCLVGIEACATAHHWAREIAALGHAVKLMPAKYVKAYVKRNKNDAADAEAICEAVSRPTMRFVPIKTPEQQALLMLHRTRKLLVRQRIRLVNAMRVHLAEFGIVAGVGRNGVDRSAADLQGRPSRARDHGRDRRRPFQTGDAGPGPVLLGAALAGDRLPDERPGRRQGRNGGRRRAMRAVPPGRLRGQ